MIDCQMQLSIRFHVCCFGLSLEMYYTKSPTCEGRLNSEDRLLQHTPVACLLALACEGLQ